MNTSLNKNDCGRSINDVGSKVRQVPEQIARQDAAICELHIQLSQLEQQLIPLFDQPPSTPKGDCTPAGQPCERPRPHQVNLRLSEHTEEIEQAVKRIAMLREKLHI